ncbi:extracellular solute-binding protein [Quadrisphaera sp. RL12-1S]|nr:extracellular solute-binding protein [Quadrisphaera sp. RL12-1S]
MPDPWTPLTRPRSSRRPSPPPTRRQVLRAAGLGIAGLGALGATAACGTPGTAPAAGAPLPAASPGEVVRLQYWAWLKDLQKVCDVWNAKNPSVQVEAVWIPGGNSGGYQKIFSALAAGSGPDLAQIEVRTLPSYLLQNGLADLSAYGFGDVIGSYDEGLASQVRLDGRLWGVPQDSGPIGFFYRTESLEAVGAQPPSTWEEWLEVARAIHGNDAGHWIDSFNAGDPTTFISIATQAGATWFKPEGEEWVIDMTDDATAAVATLFDTALDEGLLNTALPPFSVGWFAAAGSGAIASLVSGSWADALIEGTTGGEGQWRVAPVPTWASDPSLTKAVGSSYLGGSTAAITSTCAHPREALAFATWMTTDPEGIDAMIQYSGIGWSPASDYIGKARQQPSEFFSGQSYNTEVFQPAAQQQRTDWTWSPVTLQAINIVADAFRARLTGGYRTCLDALAAAQPQVVAAHRDKGLAVRAAS